MNPSDRQLAQTDAQLSQAARDARSELASGGFGNDRLAQETTGEPCLLPCTRRTLLMDWCCF
jgi:hypothetical protein